MELAFKNLKDFLESFKILKDEAVSVVPLTSFPKNYKEPSIRESIGSLVKEFGNKAVSSPKSTCFFLVHQDKGFIIPLYLIENNNEEILEPPRPSAPCQHCISAGWGNHLVTRRNYHIVIPNRWWERPVSDEGLLNDESHILHILLHSNGFGHLVCMRGVEDSSDIDLPADEVSELSRRFCKHLGARKLSRVMIEEWPVEDDPNKAHLTFVVTPQLEELKFMPAGEVVFHPYMNSFENLKDAAEKALRATYCVLKNFRITHIKDKNIEEWKEELPGLEGFESGEELSVKGSGLDMETTTLRYQGGHHTR